MMNLSIKRGLKKHGLYYRASYKIKVALRIVRRAAAYPGQLKARLLGDGK